MFITFELSDGRYIVGKDDGSIRLFKAPANGHFSFASLEEHLKQNRTCINIDHIVMIRQAKPEEIERMKCHGY